VGPVYSRTDDRSAVLSSAYRESLRVAEELGAATVAFPAISAGVYGWPMDDAARIAVETVRAHDARAVREVRFVLFGPDAYAAFTKELSQGGGRPGTAPPGPAA
jgi:O-acetyl-ADP-ribose deacetylase (regulator of RNase III)